MIESARPHVLRELSLIFIVVMVALTAGALLAWPLHLLLPDISFSRLAGRASLLCALLFSLIYLRLTLPFNARTLGFARPAGDGLLRSIATSYIAGMLIMLALSIMLLLLGIREFDSSRPFAASALSAVMIKAVIGGILVGLIEEFVFRGTLFSGLQHRINVMWAVTLTSLLYAAVHFINYPALDPDHSVHWYTGLILLPEALARLTQGAIADEFLSYFMLGILLCVLRLRDGHIYRCIALHAGIVFVLHLDRYVTAYRPGSAFDFLVSAGNQRLGWLAAVWLLLIVIMVRPWNRRGLSQAK